MDGLLVQETISVKSELRGLVGLVTNGMFPRPEEKGFWSNKKKKKIVIHSRLEMEVICINYKDRHKDEDPGEEQTSEQSGGRQKVLGSGYVGAFSVYHTKRQSSEKG